MTEKEVIMNPIDYRKSVMAKLITWKAKMDELCDR